MSLGQALLPLYTTAIKPVETVFFIIFVHDYSLFATFIHENVYFIFSIYFLLQNILKLYLFHTFDIFLHFNPYCSKIHLIYFL